MEVREVQRSEKSVSLVRMIVRSFLQGLLALLAPALSTPFCLFSFLSFSFLSFFETDVFRARGTTKNWLHSSEPDPEAKKTTEKIYPHHPSTIKSKDLFSFLKKVDPHRTFVHCIISRG